MSKSIFTAFCLILSLISTAGAQPLVDRVPGDAMIYIGWRGSDSMGPGFESSHLKAVLEASQFRMLIDDYLPRLAKKIGQKDPNAAEGMKLISTIGGAVWRHPTAIYVGPLDLSNPQMPMPRLAVLCQASEESAAIIKDLNDAIAKGDRNAPVRAEMRGDLVVFSIGVAPAADMFTDAAKATSLTSHKDYIDAAKEVVADPVVEVYVDVEQLFKTVDSLVEMGNDVQAKVMWPKIRDASGLAGAKRMILAGGFDGPDWTTAGFLAAPGPRTGLLAIIDTKPLTDDLLKVVPQSATRMMAGRFDGGRFIDELMTAIGRVDENAGQMASGTLEQVNKAVGFDVRKDLIGSFGDSWVAYTDANVGGPGLLGFALVNKLADPAKADASLGKLEQFLNAVMKQQLRKAEVTVAFVQTKVGELNLHYLAVPFITPVWAIRDGNFYFALYPQVLTAAVDQASGGGKTILENESFVALRKRLGGKPMNGVQFIDLPKTIGDGYQELLVLSRMYLGFSDLFGVPAPAMLLPPLNKMTPHAAPIGAVSWVDETGWHHRSVSAFPGSSVFSGSGLGAAMIGQQAVLISTLLPALNRAHETANRVKCASNERQIGQGILMYANEHKGSYPPDLGTILTDEDMTPEVFTCPSSDGPVPANLAHSPPQQQGAWVNENGHYVYIGQHLTTNAAPDLIVLYEKPNSHNGDGMNVLFADGHVEFLMMADAVEQIEKQEAK